jgi:hypothetical protein
MSEGQAFLAALSATLASSGAVAVAIAGYAALGGAFGVPEIFGVFAAWLVGWILACLHLMLAMPLYQLLRKLGWVNWGTAALSGAVIGILPIALLFQVSINDGWPLMELLGGAGLVGGLTFRAVLGKPEAESA